MPASLGEAGERIQNLIFGLQSERILRDAQVRRDCRVLHVVYRPPEPESVVKAIEYLARIHPDALEGRRGGHAARAETLRADDRGQSHSR